MAHVGARPPASSGRQQPVGTANATPKSDLLNILGEVKARVQDKLGIVGFPMPQFILIGNQSVGKSRLIEALAGETFNFVSGSLGSRRPTVLEFRHMPNYKTSKWYMRDKVTRQWTEMPVSRLMIEVGNCHEECGKDVTSEPIYVRIESSLCADMQMVDLPGFRDFSLDAEASILSKKIEELVRSYMQDKNNVMLCIEQAGDAANMKTLGKCKEIDSKFERTILIRTKLDKHFQDLNPSNINNWVQGFGDLPEDLNRPVRFALTLPFWKDGDPCPGSFVQMRKDMSDKDEQVMADKGLTESYKKFIGFARFQDYLTRKIEMMFSEAINPVLTNLVSLKSQHEKEAHTLQIEYTETDPHRILSTTCDCGVSFAEALTHVMEGVLDLTPVMTLEEELRAFHKHHQSLGSNHFNMLPSDDFSGLDDYINYLRSEIQIATCEVAVNGGAQFRRLMIEVEIFLRFSEITVETKKKDVIQARGVSLSSLTWRDVIVKLLSNEAHLPFRRHVAYVGERIKWFFEVQKETVLTFMEKLEGTPSGSLYSPLYPKYAKLIKQNETIKHLVFKTYDAACVRQLKLFSELFDNMLTSTFSNPWVFLKSATLSLEGKSEGLEDAVLPTFDETKERIPKELMGRSTVDTTLEKWLQEIPTENHLIDDAVDKVQMVVLKTYGFIRSQICDQVELFSESFFKLPMLRRLEGDMAQIELSDADSRSYRDRRERLGMQINRSIESIKEVSECIARLQEFKHRQEARSM